MHTFLEEEEQQQALLLEDSSTSRSTTATELERTTATRSVVSRSNPSWKTNNEIQTWLEPQSHFSPPKTPGAFLHLSKTGGSTLSLQLRNGCHSFVKKPCRSIAGHESHVSRLSTYYHNPDFDILNQTDYRFYVVSTRDPFDRTLSAFAYMHPWNKKERGVRNIQKGFYDIFDPCFPTLDSFVEALGASDNPDFGPYLDINDPIETTDCHELAHAAWHHRLKLAKHFFYDLQHVSRLMNQGRTSSSSSEVTVMVVRREALWEDWTSANQWLGQAAETVDTFPELQQRAAVAGSHPPVGTDISEANRVLLCESLRSEYQVYLEMIASAVNLSEAEKRASLEMAQRQCPQLDLTF